MASLIRVSKGQQQREWERGYIERWDKNIVKLIDVIHRSKCSVIFKKDT